MNRKGDNAEMAIIEIVDFNENLLKDTTAKSGASKRTRRGKSKVTAPIAETTPVATPEVTADSAE
jgi:large subunit ribosomal protein L17